MLKFLLMLMFLFTPNRTESLATGIALAGENSGLLVSWAEYDNLLKYVEVVKDDGDCWNDYGASDRLQPELSRIAKAYMDHKGLCTPSEDVEWLDGNEDVPDGYLWWGFRDSGNGVNTLICYHELEVCFWEANR